MEGRERERERSEGRSQGKWKGTREDGKGKEDVGSIRAEGTEGWVRTTLYGCRRGLRNVLMMKSNKSNSRLNEQQRT